MTVTLIAALDLGIRKDSGIPWKAPEDMKRFKVLKEGYSAIMGRQTRDSL